jgi:hypothetical protein
MEVPKMAQVSSVVTGGVTISAATLVPLVNWAISGFPHPVPADIPGVVAALILTGAHAIYNWAQARNGVAK